VLAAVTDHSPLETIEDKTAFLHDCHIALWDVIASCDIIGSSDSSIRNVVPNDVNRILNVADIQQIYVNGQTAFRLYQKYLLPITGRKAVCLPSTSPANAAWSVERLIDEWQCMNGYLLK
jgi:hypoxanthine-DNA glycosylase